MLCLPTSLSEVGHQGLRGAISTTSPPAILMGDFNAHSRTWGCRDTNRQGKLIEDFILKQNLSILNTGTPTYFRPGTGSLSAIDLTHSGKSQTLSYRAKYRQL